MKALPTGLSTRSKSLPTRGISCIRAALDVPLAKLFDYSVPAGMEARFVPNHLLNAAQARALDRMAGALGSFGAFLLHGVTGSGKTEVYLHLIARVLARGGQALVLVPEISLTPQLEAVFRQAFPETRLALLHSGLEDVARTGSWLEAAARARRAVCRAR